MAKPSQKKRESSMLGTGENIRTGTSIASLKKAILDNLYYIQGRTPELATKNDWYMAVAYTVRDRMLSHFIHSLKRMQDTKVKIVSYLSAEFLMGPHLGNNLLNLGITDQTRQAAKEIGLELNDLLAQEEEPGLGNGGLGRLAACYMDSLASLTVPAIGYGIRYEFGIFDQEIHDGWQVEKTDKWLRLGNPWEICRPEISYEVNFGGHTAQYLDDKGCFRVRWNPHRVVKGIAYDTPVPSYRDDMVDMLRLWKSEAIESFDFQAFNVGDYYKAVDMKVVSETVSKVLYPNDEPEIGKTLRLAQQYFFVSCSLQDMIRIHLARGKGIETFHESFAVQLNDTHPSIAVAELMRLLVDEHLMDWDSAWQITGKTMAYTNHTLLPEALEKWPLPLFKRTLPRHLEIIYEINRRFLDDVRHRYPGDDGLVARLSLIDESGEKYVRMAHLASVGSHRINGVAALHSNLLTRTVLKDLCDLYPDRFVNVTNGVTPRRWIALSNPSLTALITRSIGDRWIRHFEDEIRKIEPLADDAGFRQEWRKIKRKNKARLAAIIQERTGIVPNPDSLFDIQVKRIHEYKRQHLNVLNIITLYNRIRKNPGQEIIPRTFIFGGKAAPGYFMAKLIIKLINSVAEVINTDQDVAGRLTVVFFPDFNVKSAQHIYPAAELSEQISTAGKEASGTGNMKFSMNGALTIGTLDGANVEIREEVGQENFFLFGLSAEEVHNEKARGYRPRDYYDSNPCLREVIEQIRSGYFSRGDAELFRPLVENLLNHDPFMLLADYQSYIDCQDGVSSAYHDQERWTRMSILNVARMGKFSSDRSIREYCDTIWNIKLTKGG
ncbi:MAG: glycogen phosphorylase [Candidatus Brocadia sp.]|nr:Maltodextrin phosphorylase [Anaerolineales bacterium]MCC6326318.1 glycogen/starch/alpha-glucan phosphorylase [Candidatus Brocadia sp.]MDG5995361.1 glycogen/starch/alpha-glucan phosphorylase [Candidatus Brocadia sp.]RIJ98564.1 MAG: glycogen phosphorylase [Candidatus Brocadia sp.]